MEGVAGARADAVTVLIIFVLQNGKYAATRSFERSLAWVDPGKDRNAPGGELWLGSVGNGDPDQVF